MSPQTTQILQSALALSEDERIELAEALLETTTPSPLIDADLLAEIRRRSAEIDRGEVTLRTWAEVKQQSRDRLWGKPNG